MIDGSEILFLFFLVLNFQVCVLVNNAKLLSDHFHCIRHYVQRDDLPFSLKMQVERFLLVVMASYHH